MYSNFKPRFIIHDKKVYLFDDDVEIYKHINVEHLHSDDLSKKYASNFAFTLAKVDELLIKGKAKVRESVWELNKLK